jgi:hypothetical protein
MTVRIQSRNGCDDSLSGLHPYFTCPEAIASLIAPEGDRPPQRLWEPAAGNGVIGASAARHWPERHSLRRYP